TPETWRLDAMAMRCSVCDHEERLVIDRLLATNKCSIREIGRQFGLDKSAIHRHSHNHVTQSVVRAAERRRKLEEDVVAETFRARWDATWDRAGEGADRAAADPEKWTSGAGFIAQMIKAAELTGKAEGVILGGGESLQLHEHQHLHQVIMLPSLPVGPTHPE